MVLFVPGLRFTVTIRFCHAVNEPVELKVIPNVPPAGSSIDTPFTTRVPVHVDVLAYRKLIVVDPPTPPNTLLHSRYPLVPLVGKLTYPSPM